MRNEVAGFPKARTQTAEDESQVANIAGGKVLYLSQDSHQELYIFIPIKRQCFKCFIVFYTYKVFIKYISLILFNREIFIYNII